MKLKKKLTQGVYWSSLLCAVVRQSSTGLVLLGGNPPPAVVAFLPRPAAASSCGRRHEAPCRRVRHHTVGRTGRRFQCRHPVLQGRRLGGGWEGDDVRMWTRLRRKLRRRLLFQAGQHQSVAKMILLALQLLVYVGQIVTTIIALQRTFASYWQASPQYVFGMVIDAITGSTVVAHSPVVRAFGFSATLATASTTRRLNVYRYLTSGFVHSGLLPLLINVGVMLKLQPSWLSRSLGASLYLTTFLGSIILGNMAHVVNTTSTGGGFLAFDFTNYMGSSAGICGVYGLMFVCLTRMGQANPSKNSNRSSGNGGGFTQLLQGMLILLGVGAWMEHVNVAMNLGGFGGGILLGLLCGPGYTNDYSMTRKNSVGYDPVDRDYRAVMGFGIMPTEHGWIPLKVLHAILLTIFLAVPQYRNIPVAILKGVWNLI